MSIFLDLSTSRVKLKPILDLARRGMGDGFKSHARDYFKMNEMKAISNLILLTSTKKKY